jgi:uncharacterized membrane protein YraQ (UPF0718 family)
MDILLWLSLVLVAFAYNYALFKGEFFEWTWVSVATDSVYELMNTLWWGLALGMVAIGILGKVPRELVAALLGTHSGIRGIVRATLAGVLFDLCSHGILLIGAKLYERGASVGQVMAFLIASPWNSFSLTLVLIALIGLQWTLLFILCSMLIGIVVGCVFDFCVRLGVLPENPNKTDLPKNFQFRCFMVKQWKQFRPSFSFFKSLCFDALLDYRIVVKWLMIGVLLASFIRAVMPSDAFANYFGPSIFGLMLTVVIATIIEVCSEGSTPIAADIINQAGAPGNGFAFLMTGVSTDYTEIMILKETTKSWKIAFCLPVFTLPQVLLVSWLINQMSG